MFMFVFLLQPAGAGFGGKGDSIPGSVHSHTDGSQKSERTLPCMGLCEKELGHTSSEVSITETVLKACHINAVFNAIFNYSIFSEIFFPPQTGLVI